MPRVDQISEDDLVQQLTADLPAGRGVAVGPGDDCALVSHGGKPLLLKTDCLVEGVHFLPDAPPEQVGWKAMARVVSDIAATGGEPSHALVTLVLRPDMEVARVRQLYAGLRRCAEAFSISIVGGETSRGSQCVISISLTGNLRGRKPHLRSGARPGDAIYVTGVLGGSLAGHHLTFTPRLPAARWLARITCIHAMMDLSDGLAKDLPRMARASGVEFIVDDAALPVHAGCTVQQAWTDGEDYELLFAVPAEEARRLERSWKRAFTLLPLTRIGTFVR